MSPDFLQPLVALREEVLWALFYAQYSIVVARLGASLVALQHTRRLAAIEGQYYGSSSTGFNDDAAGAADDESQPLAVAPRAHTGGAAVEASSGRPASTSVAGRKADGLVRCAALTR